MESTNLFFAGISIKVPFFVIFGKLVNLFHNFNSICGQSLIV